MTTAAATLATETLNNKVVVVDTNGGTWHPDAGATKEIAEASDPDATAIRICEQAPMRGEWAC